MNTTKYKRKFKIHPQTKYRMIAATIDAIDASFGYFLIKCDMKNPCQATKKMRENKKKN